MIILSLYLAVAVNAAETNFNVIKSFGNREAALERIRPGLIEATDGNLYGVGAKGGRPVIFRLSKDGRQFGTIYYFSQVDELHWGVIEGSDGKLYGTTTTTIFRLEKDGRGFEVLHQFVRGTNDGYYATTGVIEGTDGALYGRADSGGVFDKGTIFRLERNGSGYRTIRSLSARSFSGLVDGTDGYLYGTTFEGGDSGAGTIFRVHKNAGDLTTIHSFSGGVGGAAPVGHLVITRGAVYGTAAGGDETNRGCIYRVQTDGSNYTLLKSFRGEGSEGIGPNGLTEGTDGLLYGVSSGTLKPNSHYGAVFKIDKNGQNFAVLHTFASTNGFQPNAAPLQASDGLLYGATKFGGEATEYDRGDGVIYRIRTDGTEFEVVRFLDRTGGEGVWPENFILGRDGFLYGTTHLGGRSNTAGVVYKLDTAGTGYSQLFSSSAVAGRHPGNLIEGRDNFLYVTAGTWEKTAVILRIAKESGQTTVLTNFGESWHPEWLSGIIHASDNRLYVGINQGGVAISSAVISLQTDGSDPRLVHSFPSTNEYWEILFEGSDGWLYGRAFLRSFNDLRDLRGSLFKLHPDGTRYVTLHMFEGEEPLSIIEGSDGLLYGTSGFRLAGELFKVSKDGTGYQVLYDLGAAALILTEGPDGLLYGNIGAGIFRIGKDGQRYTIIKADLHGNSLIAGTDSTMYLLNQYGGDMGMGSIVRFIPPPDIRIAVTSGIVEMSAEGLRGRRLRIETSSDLATWVPVAATSVSGRLSVADTNPPAIRRFYRGVLEPQS